VQVIVWREKKVLFLINMDTTDTTTFSRYLEGLTSTSAPQFSQYCSHTVTDKVYKYCFFLHMTYRICIDFKRFELPASGIYMRSLLWLTAPANMRHAPLLQRSTFLNNSCIIILSGTWHIIACAWQYITRPSTRTCTGCLKNWRPVL
jgi:hypothetical protein